MSIANFCGNLNSNDLSLRMRTKQSKIYPPILPTPLIPLRKGGGLLLSLRESRRDSWQSKKNKNIDCHDFAKAKSRNDIISYIFATNLHIFTKKFKKILHFYLFYFFFFFFF